MSTKARKTKDISKRLWTRRKKEIEKLLNARFSIENRKKVVKFLSLYIDCEAVAKKLIAYYRQDTGKHTESFEKLQYPVIYAASRYFNIAISREEIQMIFKSSEGFRGKKTPRQLRNALVHSKSIKDIEEIENRNEELMKIMVIWRDALYSTAKTRVE